MTCPCGGTGRLGGDQVRRCPCLDEGTNDALDRVTEENRQLRAQLEGERLRTRAIVARRMAELAAAKNFAGAKVLKRLADELGEAL